MSFRQRTKAPPEIGSKVEKELNVTLNEIDVFWFQNPESKAIRDGDKNTKYFHISTTIRRRYNRIEALSHDEGHWVTEAEEIK